MELESASCYFVTHPTKLEMPSQPLYKQGDLIQGIVDRGPNGPYSVQGTVLQDDDPNCNSLSVRVRVAVSNLYLIQRQAGGRWYDVSDEKRVVQVLRAAMMKIDEEAVGIVRHGRWTLW